MATSEILPFSVDTDNSTEESSKSERLLFVLSDYDDILILAHDNPDPDAIAAGWGLYELVKSRLEQPVRFVAGGEILRAENRLMQELLEPPITLVSSVRVTARTGIVLVDCGADAANHLCSDGRMTCDDPRHRITPAAVIDHHNTSNVCNLPYVDIRPTTAAAVSLVASYLHQQDIVPSERLATAMVYAMRTETRGFETHHSRLDKRALHWLTQWANPQWIAEIETAPLSRNYFGDLVLGLQNTFLYADAAFCLLPQVQGPEVVGEVADLLVRCDCVSRVFCAAAWDGAIVVSVRSRPGHQDAGQLARTTLNGLGHAGGHSHRAGGKIPKIACGRITESMEDDLRDRWLHACRIQRERGTRLIALKDIVENL